MSNTETIKRAANHDAEVMRMARDLSDKVKRLRDMGLLDDCMIDTAISAAMTLGAARGDTTREFELRLVK